MSVWFARRANKSHRPVTYTDTITQKIVNGTGNRKNILKGKKKSIE